MTALEDDEFCPSEETYGAFVPNELLRWNGVPAGEKLCYARLVQYGGKEGEAWPFLRTLAFELGVSERQTTRYLTALKKAKLIREYPASKRHGPPRYRFRRHEIFEAGVLKQPRSRGDTYVTPSVSRGDIYAGRGDTYVTPKDDTYVTPSFKNSFLKNSEKKQRSERRRSSPPFDSAGPLGTEGREAPAAVENSREFRAPLENSTNTVQSNGFLSQGGLARSAVNGANGRKAVPKAFSGPLDDDDGAEDGLEDDGAFEGFSAAPEPTAEERLAGLSEVARAAVAKSKAHVDAALKKQRKAEVGRANLKSNGTSGLSREQQKFLYAAEEVWIETMRQHFPTLKVGDWGGAERGKVRYLLAKYDGVIVLDGLRYMITEWKTLRTRFFKGEGVAPTLGTAVKFHDSFFLESQLWAQHSGAVVEYRNWVAQNPNNPYPPDDLDKRYQEAKKELEAIRLS